MNLLRRISLVLFFFFILFSNVTECQQIPVNPVSYRIFTPFIINPAIVGSKDFFSIDFIAASQRKLTSQILSGNTRLSKNGPKYFYSPVNREFTNFGMGGSVFNEATSTFRNMGASFTLSYHIPLDKEHLKYLSIGASVKGAYNKMDSVSSTNPGLSKKSKNTFYPNADLGIYYYGPFFFAGLSAANLLRNPEAPDSSGVNSIQVSKQYFLLLGYKIIISRKLNLLLEPSVILNADESPDQKVEDILKPMLKIYMQDFCFGTYFNDYSKISFFFQYKYPRFYIGAFFELPKHTSFYKKEPTVEFAIGINFSKTKSGNAKYSHW